MPINKYKVYTVHWMPENERKLRCLNGKRKTFLITHHMVNKYGRKIYP